MKIVQRSKFGPNSDNLAEGLKNVLPVVNMVCVGLNGLTGNNRKDKVM